MNSYNVYFTDYPSNSILLQANNKTEARLRGKNYIKVWNLNAEIFKIEKKEE